MEVPGSDSSGVASGCAKQTPMLTRCRVPSVACAGSGGRSCCRQRYRLACSSSWLYRKSPGRGRISTCTRARLSARHTAAMRPAGRRTAAKGGRSGMLHMPAARRRSCWIRRWCHLAMQCASERQATARLQAKQVNDSNLTVRRRDAALRQRAAQLHSVSAACLCLKRAFQAVYTHLHQHADAGVTSLALLGSVARLAAAAAAPACAANPRPPARVDRRLESFSGSKLRCRHRCPCCPPQGSSSGARRASGSSCSLPPCQSGSDESYVADYTARSLINVLQGPCFAARAVSSRPHRGELACVVTLCIGGNRRVHYVASRIHTRAVHTFILDQDLKGAWPTAGFEVMAARRRRPAAGLLQGALFKPARAAAPAAGCASYLYI